jgi:hypothetical protein
LAHRVVHVKGGVLPVRHDDPRARLKRLLGLDVDPIKNKRIIDTSATTGDVRQARSIAHQLASVILLNHE